ncbi:MAG: tRNA (adenosine(37)-N6)-dimethylallyltransferase MiaA [Flavobacteriales bacterium]|nr:tRNA (adenosine(37)-N6)-dimethylallyltransferase MiaA [Flavobacteriales bacterium]
MACTTKPVLLSIVGPTAVGKTALSIQVAKHFKAPILSADSRQMYRHIPIGTARPSLEEQDGVAHHFIDCLDLEEEYSAGQFERDALELIQGELNHHPVILLVGGSGLCVKALLEGLDDVPKDEHIREQLIQRHRTVGLAPLLEELAEYDPESYARIDRQNPQRVIRALEVCLTSGRPFSSFHSKKKVDRPFQSVLVGLRRDRMELKERIAQRYGEMMESGWMDEAREVYDKRHLNSLNTVGYKEIFRFLDGEWDEEVMEKEVIKETQRFAKRQMTWFKKMSDIHWLDLPHERPVEQIIDWVESYS